MTPASYANFLVAGTQAGAALIGLLFDHDLRVEDHQELAGAAPLCEPAIVDAAVSAFDRIMVAVADDAASSAAVGAAAELAARNGAEVLAVHVWCRDMPCCGPSAAECGLRADDDSLERALGRLREAGVRSRGERWRTVDGRVLQSLLAAADGYDAGLVIVGGRRQRWLPALLRPGLGLRLARRSARPVLLISVTQGLEPSKPHSGLLLAGHDAGG